MKKSVDLTNGPIFKTFVRFVIPILCSNVLQSLYNMADTMIAGKFAGERALAAVGMTAAPTSLMLALFSGLSIGNNVICANYFGAGDKDGVHRTVHTSVLLGLVIGFPLMIFCWILTVPFLSIMDVPAEIIGLSAVYMRIVFAGIPASMTYNFCSGILRASGDTKRPFYILIVTGLLNVILNIVFVAVFNWGVAGVAIATVISQYLSALVAVYILAHEETEIKLFFSKLRIYRRELVKIITIGLPAGINGMLANISHVVLQTATNSFGTAFIAANNVSGTIEGFCTMPIYAAEAATVSFVGQNMGAGKYDRIGKVVKTAITFAAVFTFMASLFVFVNGNFFAGLFTNDSTVIRESLYRARWVMLPYFIYSVACVLAGTLRGMGNAIWPAVSNLLCVCVFRVIWINTVWKMYPTREMIYIVYPMAWIMAGIVLSVMFLVSIRSLKGACKK